MLIILGPSASGKSECAKLLETQYELKKLITYTTRPMRINEVNHKDYHFVTKDAFLNMKANDEFIETNLYNENYYGTAKNDIADNKCIILDPNGAENIYKLHLHHTFIVFIEASYELRKKRMLTRQDNLVDIKKRLDHDDEIFNLQKCYFVNYVINNDSLTIEETTKNIYDAYKKYLSNFNN